MASLGLGQEKITLRNLENNPGMIPLKLGTAKVEEYTHRLIHFYDLNPIIVEINKLQLQTRALRESLDRNNEYAFDTANYLKILNFTEEKVTQKLTDILPYPQRVKRGLINGLGSIFKVISGNLDASDGERYDKIINELQANQIKLSSSLKSQNSLSIALINKFNSTVRQISQNERYLESKLNQVALIVQKQSIREHSIFIKDLMIQIINLYEIINSVLQDIENSISFAKLQVMHPSIMKSTELFEELQNIGKSLHKGQLPIEITLENTILLQNLIKIDSYISNNKITYVLHVPITYQQEFKYYHLYSIPVLSKSQYKAIIPKNKFLIKTELYFAFMGEPCTQISHRLHLCQKMDLQGIRDHCPCEIHLLDGRNTSCETASITMAKALINRLEGTDQWIGVFPFQQNCKLKCPHQEEVIKIATGTYLIEIPVGCQISTTGETITNRKSFTQAQPILFPNLEESESKIPKMNFSLHLQEIPLDELQSIKTQILEDHPDVSFETLSYIPSIWTLLIYALLLSALCYMAYRTIPKKWWSTTNEDQHGVELSEVQLPRQQPR